jgi:hypothetical protein
LWHGVAVVLVELGIDGYRIAGRVNARRGGNKVGGLLLLGLLLTLYCSLMDFLKRIFLVPSFVAGSWSGGEKG